jgi:large subunit ribosomal protein L17
MEHRKKGRKLKRTASHKKSLLSNLSVSLIKNKRIKTTVAKAKELRTYIEPLITKAKNAFKLKSTAPEKDIHNRRIVRKYLKDPESIKILFNQIAEIVKDRQGGYLRIIKSGFRPGDSADEAIIEFVDFKTEKVKEQKPGKVKEDKSKTPESKETQEEKNADTVDEKPVDSGKSVKKKTSAAKTKSTKTTADKKEIKKKTEKTDKKKVKEDSEKSSAKKVKKEK